MRARSSRRFQSSARTASTMSSFSPAPPEELGDEELGDRDVPVNVGEDVCRAARLVPGAGQAGVPGQEAPHALELPLADGLQDFRRALPGLERGDAWGEARERGKGEERAERREGLTARELHGRITSAGESAKGPHGGQKSLGQEKWPPSIPIHAFDRRL